MRKFSNKSILSLAGAAALCAGACSSKSPGTPTGGGGAGGSTQSFPGGDQLTPTSTGFVDDRANSGVVGAWYAYGDPAGPNANTASTDFADSDCNKGGFSMAQCSQIGMPTPGQPFPPDATTGAMCTNGTAAQVLTNATTMMADYTDLWGAGIGLDFNNLGGDSGVAKGTFDMTPFTGIGFDFTGTVIPASKMRVNFPFTGEHGTDSPYWDGGPMASSPLTNGAHVTIHWADVGGPMYLLSQTPSVTPPPFDKTKVSSIQFQVFTNTMATTPYNFCVNNLTLLKD